MLSARRLIRDAIRRLGYDVVKLSTTFGQHRQQLLQRHGVQVVFDVGANAGQFGNYLRGEGYAGKIVSIEPTSGAYAKLSARAARDAAWTALRMALGERDGTATINVSRNSQSSSILPMLDAHLAATPQAQYVSTEDVPLRRLDTIFDDHCAAGQRAFLKLDVQGYERQVLEGAERSLARIAGIQLESQVVALYEGETLLVDMLDQMRARGFVLAGVESAFENRQTGELLSLDCLYFRALTGPGSLAAPARAP